MGAQSGEYGIAWGPYIYDVHLEGEGGWGGGVWQNPDVLGRGGEGYDPLGRPILHFFVLFYTIPFPRTLL